MSLKSVAVVVQISPAMKQAEFPCGSRKPGRGEDSAASIFGQRFSVPNQASAPARAFESDAVSRLAKFFPEATPVRIPIHLSRANSNTSTQTNDPGQNGKPSQTHGWSPLRETVIEYGTPHEVLFVVSEPVEFADRVLVESKDGALRAEASIVAVQYHPERTAVAARFLNYVPNWIVKS